MDKTQNRKPIKVLNITEEGRGGGPLSRIANIAEFIHDEINTTVVLPQENSENFVELLQKKNIPYTQLRLHRLTKDPAHLLRYIIFFPYEIFLLWKLITREKIDIVHCNAAWQFKGIIACYFTKASSIWHLNDSKASRLVAILFRWVSTLADGFIFASERTKMYYSQRSPASKRKFSVIMQAPVDMARFSSSFKATSSGKIKIITTGYINHNKGFHHLIEAFISLGYHKRQDVELSIVGTTFANQQPYKDSLLHLLQAHNVQNIHFLGFRNDIPQLLADSSLYVCCSSFEASPISVWEALATGVPVVSTDVGDVKKIFTQYNYGSVVTIEDSDALAEEIHRTLMDKDLIHRMKQLGPEIAENTFSRSKIASQHIEIYQALYNNK